MPTLTPALLVVFVLGVPHQQSAGSSEWQTVHQSASRLALDNKPADAVALVQKFLDRNPNAGEAYFIQAGFYEQLAGNGATRSAEQKKQLENAARAYLRAATLITDRTAHFVILWKLYALSEPGALDRPADAEKYARRMVAEHPTEPDGHLLLARFLHDRGDLSAAADVMSKGRALAVNARTEWLLFFVQYTLEDVQANRDRPREETRRRIDETMTVLDAVLARPRDEERDFRLFTLAKSMAFELLAERVEQDHQKRIDLMLDSDRYSEPLGKFVRTSPPPRRRLTAKQLPAFEWSYIDRWNGRLMDERRFPDAITAIQQFLVDHPLEHAAIAGLAAAYVRWADDAKDKPTRVARLEQALGPAQRVIGLAPTTADREAAFAAFLELLGPSKLDRPALVDNAIRTMVQHYPMDFEPHAMLATALYAAGKFEEADVALAAARKALPATAATRLDLAGQLLARLHREPTLSAESARRLFAAAGLLVSEGEKLAPNRPESLEARAGLLRAQADHFETDPVKIKALNDQSKQLLDRALALRNRKLLVTKVSRFA